MRANADVSLSHSPTVPFGDGTFIDALYLSGVGRVLRDYERRYTLGDDSVPMPDVASRDIAPTAAVGCWRK